MTNKQALREAAQEEIMLRLVSDTSDAWQELASPEAVLALLDELEAKDKRIAELEAREVVLPKPSMVKYVSGEFIHCWPAYTVDSAIRAAGIITRIED